MDLYIQLSTSPGLAHQYSRIIGENCEPFETLISDLMTSSAEQLSQAELLLNVFKEQYPDILVRKLVHLLEPSNCLATRAMSIILLQNLFEQIDPKTLNESTRLLVKSGLLNCVEKEENKWIIRKLSDAIFVLAAYISADNGWPELLKFIKDRIAGDPTDLDLLEKDRIAGDPTDLDLLEKDRIASRLQESALLIFARVARFVGKSLLPDITLLHGVFMRCLGDISTRKDVRIAALIAVINFIRCLESLSDRHSFEVLLPGMMQCLKYKVLNDGDEATVQDALNLLIALANTDPGFFRVHLVDVVGDMLQIAEAESLEEGTRHFAIKFVITLVEWEQAPMMMGKFPQLLDRLFVILMKMLLDFEDDEEWNSAENEDEDESSNFSIGKECFHSLATVLGGNTIVLLSEYLAALEWQKHLAALIALSQITKGRSKVVIRNLEQVVTMVLKSFKDPHPRVRLAAIIAIEQLSTYVGPSLQVRYQDLVLKALLASARDDVNPRSVQALAVSAVLHFSSHSPNLDGIILNKLIVLQLTDLIIRVLQLADSLEESADVQIRASSAVKLGKMFEKPLAVLTLDLVKRKLLTCVGKEDDRSVMKSLCHTIVTFFNVLCIETGWPELFSFLNQWASGDNDFLKEASMFISGPLRFFTKNRPISLVEYCACLENDSEHIRIAAFGAAICCIQCTHRDMDVLVSPMMQVLTTGQEVTKKKALELLIEYAHQIKHPTKDFSGRQEVIQFFSKFVNSAIDIANRQNLKKETRHLAIDFVITLEEGMLINSELKINKLFEILMLDIDEATLHWVENEDDDAWESSNFSVLLKFLDRLAFKLDKDAWTKLEQYLEAPDRQKRVVAINILARNSKVYLKATKKDFYRLVKMVVDQLKYDDEHVKLAAIHVIDQLSYDLNPDLQLQYHSHVIPFLHIAVGGCKYKQVKKHAACVVVKISKNNRPENLTPELLQMAVCELRGREGH